MKQDTLSLSQKRAAAEQAAALAAEVAEATEETEAAEMAKVTEANVADATGSAAPASPPAAKESEAAPEKIPGTPTAAEAFAGFLSALSPREQQVLYSILTRLREYEALRQEGMRRAEEEACLAAMEKEPAFAGIQERGNALQALISKVDWLKELPVRDRLAAACYIDRGLRWHTPTQEEKLNGLLSDPALLRALAEKQASLRCAQGQTVPPLSPGEGRSPAMVLKPPSSLKEAKKEAMRALRAK